MQSSKTKSKVATDGLGAASVKSVTISKLKDWLNGDFAWMYMSSIKGGHLIRWQILKAAAKERGYLGPVSHKEIANDPDSARSAWLAWLATKDFHLAWFYVKLDDLLSKDKFKTFRHILVQSCTLLDCKT